MTVSEKRRPDLTTLSTWPLMRMVPAAAGPSSHVMPPDKEVVRHTPVC